MQIFYNEDELETLISEDNFLLPDFIKHIKIDVGLAGNAQNSAKWLSETNDRYIFAFEPLPHHWNMLTNFENSGTNLEYPMNYKIIQLFDKSVKYQKNIVCSIENRFTGIQCAIDICDGIKRSLFYEMDRNYGASGASSLLPPSQHHPHYVNDVIIVKTISLETFLSKINWNKFPFIEHLKTDCEGKDFDVVKSCGIYLDKIVFITSEMTGNLHHTIGSYNPQEFINFMEERGFSIMDISNGNINFVNNNLKHFIEPHNLSNNTLGL